jgi:hypothetical protein
MTDSIWTWIFIAALLLNAVALVRHHLALRRFNIVQRKLEDLIATRRL